MDLNAAALAVGIAERLLGAIRIPKPPLPPPPAPAPPPIGGFFRRRR